MAPLIAYWFRSRWASAICVGVAVLALALPPDGPKIPLCQFKLLTGLPCLACGLTRSFIGIAHLNVARAVFFNPTGILLFPLVIFTAALLPCPPRIRERCARWAENHALMVNCLAGALLAVFLVNGIGRIVWLVQTRQPSPW